jgi:hypothetical protein
VKTDKALTAQEARRAAREAMAEYQKTCTTAARKKLLDAIEEWQRALVALKRMRTRALH